MTEQIIYTNKTNFSIEESNLPQHLNKTLYITNLFNIFIHLESSETGDHIIYYHFQPSRDDFLLHYDENKSCIVWTQTLPISFFSNVYPQVQKIKLTLPLSLKEYTYITDNTIHCPLHLNS